MSEDGNHGRSEDLHWEQARSVWSAGGKQLPKTLDNDDLRFLTALEVAAGTYRAAKKVTESDRNRDWTPDQVADQCDALARALYQLDDTIFARLAGASRAPIQSIIPETIANLHLLESAFRNAKMPTLPRKKKQEHNNFLVSILADIYERHTGKRASVYSNRTSNKRVGLFVEFVAAFNAQFLSGEISNLNARAIQRALQTRAKNPPPTSV